MVRFAPLTVGLRFLHRSHLTCSILEMGRQGPAGFFNGKFTIVICSVRTLMLKIALLLFIIIVIINYYYLSLFTNYYYYLHYC